MNDIETTSDLHVLVTVFYEKLLSDNSISYIFTDRVKINLEEHLPILVSFWSQAILGTGGYVNNLTNIHTNVNKIEPLTPELFEIWLNHFNASVDENYAGENAQKIKAIALQIATVMKIKMTQ
jgi:hemoglobin